MTSVHRLKDITSGTSDIRIALAGMTGIAIAMGIGRFAFTPLLPVMQQDAGLSISEGGWLASANYLGYLVGALLAARAQLRAVTAIRAGLLTISLSTLAMSVGDEFGVWLLLRTAAGIANAWVAIHVFAWCLDRIPAHRLLHRGLVFAGVGAGIAIAGVLCLLLMHWDNDSDRAWLVLGAMSLVGTIRLWPMFAAPATEASRQETAPITDGATWDRNAVGLVICFGTAGFGYITSATFLPAIARQAIPDPGLFGWAWPVFGLAAMASTLIAAALFYVFTIRRVWMASQLLMAAGAALPAIFPGLAAVLVSALLVGATFMVITMASVQEAGAASTGDPTPLIAALTAAFALGQLLGPAVSASIASSTGSFSIPLLIASSVLLIGTGGLALGRNHIRRLRRSLEGSS